MGVYGCFVGGLGGLWAVSSSTTNELVVDMWGNCWNRLPNYCSEFSKAAVNGCFRKKAQSTLRYSNLCNSTFPNSDEIPLSP